MKLKKRKGLLLVVGVVIVSIIVIALVFYGFHFQVAEKGITAMEGKPIADEIARNWNANATLVSVREGGKMLSEGRFSSWYYVYYNSSIISRPMMCIEIKVYTDSRNETYTYELWSVEKMSIGGWTIDSDDAYKLATANDKIKAFFSKYSPYLDGFFLSASTYTQNKSVWFIDWCDPGFMDNPKWAKIEIDATTGEVLHVEADE